jgi:DNA-binding FrmR family transcriptional regulator
VVVAKIAAVKAAIETIEGKVLPYQHQAEVAITEKVNTRQSYHEKEVQPIIEHLIYSMEGAVKG